MKTTPRTICSTIAAALAISMLAGACGDSSTDQTVVESDAASATAVDETAGSASAAEETTSSSDSDNAGQTSDSGSQATSETGDQASSGDDTAASQSEPADDGYDDMADDDYDDMGDDGYDDMADDEMADDGYDEMADDDMVASQPEAAGEDCDAVKDRNELRLDIEGPAAVIVNDVARPGDECDFHMLYIDGMSRGVNSNGIVQLSITCDNPDDVEVALSGPGGFDYRHGANNGKRYECGDTWTESVNYQSDKVFFTVYIRPLRETGASSYQVVALPAPT
ncbi:MAG: hypothetical protein ACPGNP_08470 [Acidimicrobiales bacterium]